MLYSRYMRQEQVISKIGETGPTDFIEKIPKLSVDGDLSLADVKEGLIFNQDIRQQLLDAGLKTDEITDIQWSLRQVHAELGDPMLFEGVYAKMSVSEMRETLDVLDDEDWFQAIGSKRNLQILRKLF